VAGAQCCADRGGGPREATVMATRSDLQWLVVYHPRGPFVAREDSPAARTAKKRGALTSSLYGTIDEAYLRLREIREKSHAVHR
jgi:hypothetical protein